MNVDERNKKRAAIYNKVLFNMQFLGMYSTFGSFLDDFEMWMNGQLGECTQEDIQWAYERLDRFVMKNAKNNQ